MNGETCAIGGRHMPSPAEEWLLDLWEEGLSSHAKSLVQTVIHKDENTDFISLVSTSMRVSTSLGIAGALHYYGQAPALETNQSLFPKPFFFFYIFFVSFNLRFQEHSVHKVQRSKILTLCT